MPVINCLTSLTFWFVYYFVQTDRFPNTFNFSGTLLHSCVNRRYNSNVTGCLSYLKILHYKVLQDTSHFYISSFL